jgi:hypothetical protein
MDISILDACLLRPMLHAHRAQRHPCIAGGRRYAVTRRTSERTGYLMKKLVLLYGAENPAI